MNRDTVLVTGSRGLIGGAVQTLLEERGTRVIPIDLSPRAEEGRRTVECDITDIHRLHAIVAGQHVGGIIHCGAYSGPMVARDNPYAVVRVNVVGTANILEIARIHNIKRIVFCSSTSAYGSTPPGLVPEDVTLSPSSVYGASKVAGEQLVTAYSKQHGVDGVSLRLSWVFGPNRTTDCLIRTLIQDALAGRPARQPFGRSFHRQYIHVDDAARALVAALDRPRLPRHAYTVTGGTYHTLAEIGDVVRRIFPGADITFGEGPDPVDDVQSQFDISAAARDLDFRPSVGLEEGMRSYAEYLKSRGKT